MQPYNDRLADAERSLAAAKERMRNPVIDPRQKFAAGTEVYVRPIFESWMLHFQGDLITTIEGTYAQLYHRFDDRSFSQYALEIASWYNEDQLMPARGRSIEECRAACADFFGASYPDMLGVRARAIARSPLRAMFAG